MIGQYVLYLVGFILFAVIQSVFINGVKESFSEGMVFNKTGKRLQSLIKKEWVWMPVFTCVRCMSSFWSALTFFPVAIRLFGFRPFEIFVWVIDVFVLVYLNFYFYKKI